MCAVYAIRAGECGPVKIGYSEDVPSRMVKMQADNHEHLKVLRIWEGGEAEEARLHALFADLNTHGEWFSFSRKMLGDVGLKDTVVAPPPAPPPPPEPVEPEAPIGPRLVFLRKSRNLTQARVANDLGVARSTLASIEACGDMPGRTLLMSLARYYGLTADELCGASA